MTTEAAQLQFAGEFSVFLVALALLAVVTLRSTLLTANPAARAGLVLGSVALAGGSFLHGSLLLEDADEIVLVSFRAVGILAIAAATLFWAADHFSRVLFLVGLGVLGAAEVVTSGDGELFADALRVGGALVLGAGLLLASRTSIATRIATSAGAAVLGVILIVAMSLSFVIAASVEDEAVRRYGNRAQTESDLYRELETQAETTAKTVVESLSGDRSLFALAVLVNTEDPDEADTVRRAFEQALGDVRRRVISCEDARCPAVPTVLLDASQQSLAAVDASGTTLFELIGSRAAANTYESRQVESQISNVGGVLMAVAAAPLTDPGTNELLAVVVSATRIDEQFLSQRFDDAQATEEGLGAALVDRVSRGDGTTLAAAGPQDLAETLRLGDAVLDSGELENAIGDDRLFVGVPLLNEFDEPIAAVIVSAPLAQIDSTRQDLFQSLFIVALIAATAAMALSGFFGNRVGSTVVSLTGATREIEQGRFDTRVDVDSGDELGQLATSVNAMAGSLTTMTSDLRRAAADEAALRGRLEGVVGGMGEALIAVDDSGLITDFNAAAEELFGVPGRDAIGKGLPAIAVVVDEFGSDVSKRFVEPVVEAFGIAGFVSVDEGDDIPIAVSGSPLRGAGGVLAGATFVVRDMRREAEIEAMKTNFIANVSHELRTPLTPIKGYSEILANREMDTERVQRFAGEISSAAGQLERIVNQLVQFATMAAGRLTLQREEIPPSELIDAALDRWRGKVEHHTISRRVSKDAPVAPVDRRYLDHVFDELIDNAVKYSPDGGKVRLSASAHLNGHGPHLLLQVQDQGVGIDPARAHDIFDEFAQGDASATRQFGGLGLGLSLVSRIVRAHGGEVDCVSEVGKGTNVKIFLPLEVDASADDPASDGEES